MILKMPKISNTKYLVMMEQDEAPHLSKQEIDEIEASTPPHLRDARRRGIPSMGSGAIYPVPESEILVDPIEIPDYWPRAAGLDVGWKRTACIWGAVDRNTGVRYLYDEYYRGEAEPSVHASGIRARGDWIPCAIDPGARGRGQRDGEQLFQDYLDLGLNLVIADNTRESGILNVYQALSQGQLKVFNTLQNWLMEYRLYRRDEKGRIVKENDHLMDGTRYLNATGFDYAIIRPKERPDVMRDYLTERNQRTGY